MSFQENLIRARKARGMTQEELAARLSISRQAVSKWETGESLPDLYKLAALADELGVSTDELCGREAALCGEVPATAFAGDAAEREAFAEEIRRIAKQNRSLRYVVGILVLICGVLTMLSGYRSLQNSKAPSNEITTPAPLPDTITISGLTLDIDGIALVFRFVPSVSGEGYEWSASCAPDDNGYIAVKTIMEDGICSVWISNIPAFECSAVRRRYAFCHRDERGGEPQHLPCHRHPRRGKQHLLGPTGVMPRQTIKQTMPDGCPSGQLFFRLRTTARPRAYPDKGRGSGPDADDT